MALGDGLFSRAARAFVLWASAAGYARVATVSLLLAGIAGYWWLTMDGRGGASAGQDEAMSPDTVSSLFPDRPIRPLPRRRLRERLSPEAADTIQYPQPPVSATPLFYYPYRKDEGAEPSALGNTEQPAEARGVGYAAPGAESEDERVLRRSPQPRSANAGGRPSRATKADYLPRHTADPLPRSTASSLDGYDSFENTNNKKRKIPSTGEAVNGGHSLTEGSSGTDTSSPTHEGQNDGFGPASTGHYGSGAFASGSPGISGPGRGRYGRARNGRSPLRALSDATSNWVGRNGKLRPSQWAAPPVENGGIITSAIANANISEERLAATQGQENISLLSQGATKTGQTSTQFTFTCDSQVPGNVPWPGLDPKTTTLPLHQQGASAPAHWQSSRTRTDPAAAPVGMAGTASAGASSAPPEKGTAGAKNPAQRKKKSRNRVNKELEEQARARKREQELYNYQNPPGDDMYICPFCDFETVNGYKPKMLIRAFEMKERKKRLEAERRQRLLEKAKARGRKGKKGKSLAKTAPDHTAHPGQAPLMNTNPSEETRSDEYDEDDYGEDGEGYGPHDHHHHCDHVHDHDHHHHDYRADALGGGLMPGTFPEHVHHPARPPVGAA